MGKINELYISKAACMNSCHNTVHDFKIISKGETPGYKRCAIKLTKSKMKFKLSFNIVLILI